MPDDRMKRLQVRQSDELGNFDETLIKYKQTLEKLRSFGVRISDQSRLISYQRRLEALTMQPGDPLSVSWENADEMLFCFREMDELINIIDSFTEEPSSSELERLRLLPGGTANPDDGTSTKAQDAQYELFLRAMYSYSGIDIQMGIPDILLSDGPFVIPIEAKRPSSSSRLDDRLREAVHQLDTQKCFGVVAISLDHVIRPRGGFLVVDDKSYLAAAVASLVKTYIMENIRTIAKRVRNRPKVSALLFTFRTPARESNTNLTLLGSNIHTEPLSDPSLPNFPVLQAFIKIMDRVRI